MASLNEHLEARETLTRARSLNEQFFQTFKSETEKKSSLFASLRNKIKYKTEESMKKLIENESKILQQVTNLENKFIEIYEAFFKFEHEIEDKLNQLEPALNESKQANYKQLNESIRSELANLENLNDKYQQLTSKENDLETVEFKIDETFLNKLIEKNNIFMKESLEYHQYNNKPKLSKCAKCSLDLNGTYNIFNEQKFHSHCFLCCQCNLEILENVFYTNNDSNEIKPLCRVCFNLNLVEKANVCHKCEQPILDTLINFKNFHFHDYCLVCDACEKSLIGVAIYSDKENRPFCIECYTQKEAKQCAICSQLIVPNQTSFLFESKHFHKGGLNLF